MRCSLGSILEHWLIFDTGPIAARSRPSRPSCSGSAAVLSCLLGHLGFGGGRKTSTDRGLRPLRSDQCFERSDRLRYLHLQPLFHPRRTHSLVDRSLLTPWGAFCRSSAASPVRASCSSYCSSTASESSQARYYCI